MIATVTVAVILALAIKVLLWIGVSWVVYWAMTDVFGLDIDVTIYWTAVAILFVVSMLMSRVGNSRRDDDY